MGKGSKRRPEDNAAYRANHQRIFRGARVIADPEFGIPSPDAEREWRRKLHQRRL